MENKKRCYTLLQVIAILVAVSLIMSIGFAFLDNYNADKMADRLRNAFDEVDRKIAIEQLSELKGRVEELDRLLINYPTYNNLDVVNFVGKELDSIENWSTGSNNPYLKGLTIDFSSVDKAEKSTVLYYNDKCTYVREFLAQQINAID